MFGLPPLLAHIAEIASITLLVAIAAGAGIYVLQLLRISALLSPAERLLFGTLLGYGIFSFSVLAMGLLHILYTPVLLVVLAIYAVLGYYPLVEALREIAPALRRSLKALRHPVCLFLAAVIALTLVAVLLRALVPVATQDDLMYHLALPRRYAEQHAVLFYPDSNYSLFPQLMEMLYTLGLLLGSDRLSILFAFSAGLLAPASAALFARRFLAERGGTWPALPLLTAALFITVPLAGYIMRAANTDLAQAGAEMLAVYAFLLALKGAGRPDSRLLALSGICGGLAFSIKYYGVVLPLILGVTLLILLVLRLRGKDKALDWRGAAAGLLAYSLPAITIAGVWLLRNWISSGNPVWPAAGAIFGGAYWTPAADPEVLLGRTPGLSLSSFLSGLDYRLYAITRPPQSLDNNLYVVSIGPLLMPALLSLFLARWKRTLDLLFWVAAVLWVVSLFYFSRTSIRYLFTFFLFSAILGAYGIISIAARARIARIALSVVLALSLSLLTLDSLLSTGPYLSTVVALDNAAEQQYLAAHMEDYPIVQYIATTTPSNAIIYVWDSIPRGYRIPRSYIYGRLIPGYSGISTDTAAWHARLKQLGVTHVLVHNRTILAPGYPAGYDPDRATEQALAARYYGPPLITTPSGSDSYTLFALK